jgi:hypothetical protein
MRELNVPRVVTKKFGQKKLDKKRAKAHRAAAAASKRMQKKDVPGTVSEERLFLPDGHRRRVLTLDANSATFTSDLTLMFEKNVARARREHRKKSGSPGRAGQRA